MRCTPIVRLSLIVVFLSACAATPAPTTSVGAPSPSQPAATRSTSSQPASTAVSLPPLPKPSVIDYASVHHFAIGEPIQLSTDGTTVGGRITVLRVAQVSAWGDPAIPGDSPASAAAVFLAAQVEYEAVGTSFAYTPESWTLVNDVGNYVRGAHPPDGPTEMLGTGTLAAGTSITGWLIFEIAPDGLALLNPVPATKAAVQAPPWVVLLRDAAEAIPVGTPVPAGAAP